MDPGVVAPVAVEAAQPRGTSPSPQWFCLGERRAAWSGDSAIASLTPTPTRSAPFVVGRAMWVPGARSGAVRALQERNRRVSMCPTMASIFAEGNCSAKNVGGVERSAAAPRPPLGAQGQHVAVAVGGEGASARNGSRVLVGASACENVVACSGVGGPGRRVRSHTTESPQIMGPLQRLGWPQACKPCDRPKQGKRRGRQMIWYRGAPQAMGSPRAMGSTHAMESPSPLLPPTKLGCTRSQDGQLSLHFVVIMPCSRCLGTTPVGGRADA